MSNPNVVINQIMHAAAHARRLEITSQIASITGGKVMSGPFMGMIIPNQVSWGVGDNAPKILGCYEAELHAQIEKAIARQPDVIVNVGCAEGYYAIGLSQRLPEAKVYAFDISPEAQTICAAAAKENGASERITINGKCEAKNLIELAGDGKKALIVMDCEGGELELLDDNTASHLTNCDIIVECHDFANRAITPTLLSRFKAKHEIEIIREGGRDPASFPLLHPLGSFDRWLTVCEFRPEVMSWLACWATRATPG